MSASRRNVSSACLRSVMSCRNALKAYRPPARTALIVISTRNSRPSRRTTSSSRRRSNSGAFPVSMNRWSPRVCEPR